MHRQVVVSLERRRQLARIAADAGGGASVAETAAVQHHAQPSHRRVVPPRARMNCMSTVGLPFGAVVGQEAMKTGLVLNAVNPAIGGVLIRGQRGTAKSTAV